MVGYDSITPQAPLVAAKVPPSNPDRKFHHEVRNIFVDLGFTEVHNYSFLSQESARAFGLEPSAHVKVTNPIASDQALLRMSLLPGIWKNITENSKHKDEFRLFEIGLEIHARSTGLPDEIPHLAAAIYDRESERLLELKGVAESLMPGAQARPAEARTFEHPARAAEIVWKQTVVGRLSELHPSLIETGRAAVLDLDLRVVQSLGTAEIRYTPIRRYPSSAFDLSVIASAREHVGVLQERVESFAGPLLESIEFLRQYSGEQTGEGRKSVSFRLTVGSAERTLSSDEVSDIRERIIQGMRGLGYELRV
jgi:phenylalanyl-tRNA synthetase beta chain